MYSRGLFLSVLFSLARLGWAQAPIDPALDAEIHSLAMDESALAKGEAVYAAMCFACHGKGLEGLAGPSLKDGAWVHGGTPSQIFHTLTKGVADKGMMSYEYIYGEATRKALVAFMLSRQEGLRDLQYRLVEVPEKPADPEGVELETFSLDGFSLDGLPVIKEGAFENGLIDPAVAETDTFAMSVTGNLHIGIAGKYDYRFTMITDAVAVWIDGKRNALTLDEKRRKVVLEPTELSAGVHAFRMDFVKRKNRPEISLTFHGPKNLTQGAMTVDGHKKLFDSFTFPVETTTRAQVRRTRLPGLPGGTVAVGLPEGVNFAVQPRGGAILAIWTGNFLDIGPNIDGRGREPSKFLANPWMIGEPGIQLQIDGEPVALRLVEYRYEAEQLIFEFAHQGEARVVLHGHVSDGKLHMDYQLKGFDDLAEKHVSLLAPIGTTLEGEAGQFSDQRYTVSSKHASSFSVAIFQAR